MKALVALFLETKQGAFIKAGTFIMIAQYGIPLFYHRIKNQSKIECYLQEWKFISISKIRLIKRACALNFTPIRVLKFFNNELNFAALRI